MTDGPIPMREPISAAWTVSPSHRLVKASRVVSAAQSAPRRTLPVSGLPRVEVTGGFRRR
jgi:hypothetical protein